MIIEATIDNGTSDGRSNQSTSKPDEADDGIDRFSVFSPASFSSGMADYQQALIIILILIIGYAGNTVIICVYRKRTNDVTRTYVLMYAMLDIVSLTFLVPQVALLQYYTPMWMNLFWGILSITGTTNIFLLVGLAFERALVLYRPLTGRESINCIRRVALGVFVTYAVIFSSIRAILRTTDELDWFTLVIRINFAVVHILFLVLFLLYVYVIVKIVANERKMSPHKTTFKLASLKQWRCNRNSKRTVPVVIEPASGDNSPTATDDNVVLWRKRISDATLTPAVNNIAAVRDDVPAASNDDALPPNDDIVTIVDRVTVPNDSLSPASADNALVRSVVISSNDNAHSLSDVTALNNNEIVSIPVTSSKDKAHSLSDVTVSHISHSLSNTTASHDNSHSPGGVTASQDTAHEPGYVSCATNSDAPAMSSNAPEPTDGLSNPSESVESTPVHTGNASESSDKSSPGSGDSSAGSGDISAGSTDFTVLRSSLTVQR